jgi:hypothetical protein
MPANNATDGIGTPSDSEHASATVVRAAVASIEEGVAAEVVDAGGAESIEHSRRFRGGGGIIITHLSPLPPPHSAELAQWLVSIRPSFASYAPALRECGYEDLSCLRDVDEADFKEALMEVGMDKQGHRAMVLRRFRELI